MKQLEAFKNVFKSSSSPYTPYAHQLEAIEGILHTFKTHDRAHVIMACGTGKTSVCLWTAERLHVHRIVVFLPSLALINQTLHEWVAATKWKNVSQLIVCSDQTVTHGVEEPLIELEENNSPVTTSSIAINDFLKRERKGPLIVFCTYQSSSMLAQGMKNCKPFDLGIFDEAHRTTGTKDRQFNLGVSNKYIKIDKRLFVTATPRHFKLHTSSRENKASIYSMDSEKIYGPLAYKLSFRESIQRELISDYKIIISAVVNKPEIKNINTKQWDQNAIALQKAINICNAKKIITFHKSILDAEQFIDNLNLKGYLPEIRSFHINSFMAVKDRMNIMNLFNNTERAVISNARCLTEGTNVPAVDMVAFLSPKRSKIDIVQAIGRALRKSKDKTTGYIFLPLFVDLKENETLEEAIQRSDYGDIWEVLEALGEYDEDLHSTIRFLKINKNRPNAIGPAGLDKYIRIISSEADLKFKLNLKRSIEVSIVDKFRSAWDEMYGQLLAYKDMHGNTSVPQKYRKNPPLAAWVSYQRSSFKNNLLPKDKILLLNKINFIWDPFEDDWNENYSNLKKYKIKYGNFIILRNNKEFQLLRSWMYTQRKKYELKKISEENINLLNKIGFDWNPVQSFWVKNFEKLKVFKEKHHHCNVPGRYKPDISLGNWVANQRACYKENSISKSKIKMLDAIGFQWSLANINDIVWEKRYQELVDFKKKHHHCNVPGNYKPNISLANWVANQRACYKENSISKSKIKMLDSIGFQWSNINDIVWKNRYQELIDFKKKHHHCNVPGNYKPNIPLGNWVATQRIRYRENLINQTQIKMLDAIGFQWSSPKKWQNRYQELVDFKKKNGHCNILRSNTQHSQLSLWIKRQRRMFNKNKLSSQQIELLNEISFSWGRWEQRWNENFLQLKEFFRTHKHVRVNGKENKSLAYWVRIQRKKLRNNMLTREQVSLLKSIHFT